MNVNLIRLQGSRSGRREQLRSGSAEAQFRGLYAEYRDDIWRYCLRRLATPQEAEDVFNSAFTVVWVNFDEVPDVEEAVRPWLYAVARNQIRNSERKSSRYYQLKQRLLQEPNDSKQQADPAGVAVGGAAVVGRALRTLKEGDQELLKLVAWENLSHAENRSSSGM